MQFYKEKKEVICLASSFILAVSGPFWPYPDHLGRIRTILAVSGPFGRIRTILAVSGPLWPYPDHFGRIQTILAVSGPFGRIRTILADLVLNPVLLR